MKLYLAHAYGRRHGLPDEECELNAIKSIAIQRELITKGYDVYNPLLYHFVHRGWSESLPESKYFKLVSSWLRFCDAVFVGELPSWPNSGVQREVEMAEVLGMPVFYSMEELNGF